MADGGKLGRRVARKVRGMTGQFLTADRPDAEPEIATTRLGASLHPFPTAAGARAALIEAGGTNIREDRRR